MLSNGKWHRKFRMFVGLEIRKAEIEMLAVRSGELWPIGRADLRKNVAWMSLAQLGVISALLWQWFGIFLRSALINCFRCDGFIRQVKKVIMVKGSHETVGSSKIKCSIQKVYRAG